MKNEEIETRIRLTPEQERVWKKLWEFANHSISSVDGNIDWETFLNDGHSLFEVKSKQVP